MGEMDKETENLCLYFQKTILWESIKNYLTIFFYFDKISKSLYEILIICPDSSVGRAED